jgi:hypothetical protein
MIGHETLALDEHSPVLDPKSHLSAMQVTPSSRSMMSASASTLATRPNRLGFRRRREQPALQGKSISSISGVQVLQM